MDTSTATAYAGCLAGCLLDGQVRPAFGREMADKLAGEGHTMAAEIVRMALAEVERRRLTAVLPGGVR